MINSPNTGSWVQKFPMSRDITKVRREGIEPPTR